MIKVLLMCSVAFSSVAPVPSTLQQLYTSAYGCTQISGVSRQTARAPLADINEYFPVSPKTWPILHGNDSDIYQKASGWLAQGIKPGILLPENARTVLSHSAQLRQLQSAVKAGALPIAPLQVPLPRNLEAARYIWCLSGMCPVAWYIPNGMSHDLALLPHGLYLVAPHWVGNPSLPIPNRELHVWGQTILPLHTFTPRAGGVAAVLQPDGRARAFVPTSSQNWHWLGIDFVRDNTGLHTNSLGQLLMGGGQLSVRVWAILDAWQSNIMLILSKNFGWLVLVFGLLNLMALALIIGWRRRGPGAENIV